MTTTRHSPASVRDAVGRMGRIVGWFRRRPGLRVQSRPTWLRVVVGMVGLGYLMAAFIVLAFFEVPSGFHGWLPAALGYLPGLLVISLGMGIGRWPVAVAWAAGAALAMGSGAHFVAAPVHERIEAEAAEVGTPAGWTVVEGAWTGNTWGLWNSWPEVAYTYSTADSAQVAAEEYAALLEAEGWERDTTDRRTDPGPGTVAQAWEKGRWSIRVRVAGPGSEPRQFDTLVPAPMTRVDVYVDGQR